MQSGIANRAHRRAILSHTLVWIGSGVPRNHACVSLALPHPAEARSNSMVLNQLYGQVLQCIRGVVAIRSRASRGFGHRVAHQ